MNLTIKIEDINQHQIDELRKIKGLKPNIIELNMFDSTQTFDSIEDVLDDIEAIQAAFSSPVNHEPTLTIPAKIAPSDLYKNLTTTELVQEVQNLKEMAQLALSANRLSKLDILLTEVRRQINLRCDALLEQVDF